MKKIDDDAKRLLLEFAENECKVNPLEEVAFPEPVLSLGSKQYINKDGVTEVPIPIGTKGNFSFIQAPPKSKKTFFMSLLSAIYLKNGYLDTFGGDIKSFRDNKYLIHFDTEQSVPHSQRVFRRPIDMTGINDERYLTYSLRSLDYKERLELIEYVLYQKVEEGQVGLVIIDGVADLCSDVNNIEESNALVQKLMKWSKELNCHIITVIHSNFGSDKPTGHLGSFLEKKTETQIQLELNTVNKDLVTVSCKRSRNASFETFSFKVNNFGLPQVEGAVYDPLKGVF
jgi:AAA domain